jgi:hypothetical protein
MPSTSRRSPLPLILAIAATLTASLLLLITTSTTADAEEVFTSQAAATHATDSTWIPAPPKRAALCLIDTGVTPNPDTTNVIARFSVDNGDPSDLSPDHHGTLMAMIASAPYNNFGMVGAAPSINIISIRASRDGRTFGGPDVASAIQSCVNKRTSYNIKAISMSFGGASISDLDAYNMSLTEDAVGRARRVGLVVLGAAGNHEGPVDWPAGYDPVVAVGAADNSGRLCDFAASGAEVDVWAPGCPLDVASTDGVPAWGSGSSASTAFVAGVLVQLRQEKDDLAGVEAENLLTMQRAQLAEAPLLDVDSYFRNAGLNAALAAGRNLRPSPQLTPDTASVRHPLAAPVGTVMSAPHGEMPHTSARPPLESSKNTQLPRPRARGARIQGRAFSATLVNRPKAVEVHVSVFARPERRRAPQLLRTVRLRTSRLRIRASQPISQVRITYRDRARIGSDSPPFTTLVIKASS